MIDDEDGIDLDRREALVARERAYYAPVRRRRSRIWRRERAIDRADRADREEADFERQTFALAGFGLGGGGAALVMIGILLMAIAYFGVGFDGGIGAGYPADYATGGFSPEVGPYASGFEGGDLLSQRPMMFMGGGFLFLAGWILVVASRLRALLTADDY